MNHLKRILAAVLVLAMLACAGCGSAPAEPQETWYAKYGDVEVTPGVYNLMLLQAVNTIVDTNDVDYKDAYTTGVGDKTGEQYVKDYAAQQIAYYCYVAKLFADKGMELTSTDSYSAQYYAGSSYENNKAMFAALGISTQDLLNTYSTDARISKLFAAEYGEGGQFAVSAEEKQKLMREKYYRAQYLYFDLSPADGEAGAQVPLTDEEIAAKRKSAQEYLDRYQAGAKFEDLAYEYAKATAEEGTEVTRQADTAYDYYFAKDDTAMPEAVRTALAKLAVDEAVLVEDENSIVVLRLLDINGTADENWQSYAVSLLQESYGSDYTAYLTEQAKAVELEYNEKAVDRYTTAAFMKALKKYIFDARVEALS